MDLFGTAGIRGSAVETVTPELALAVGRAAGRDAVEQSSTSNQKSGISDDGREFVVARDGRETGPALAAAMEAGLESAGADVRRAGQLPSPALAFASQGRRGAMLTASHNPPTDNGIKLFADGREYDRDAERTIDRRVEADELPVAWDEWGDRERVDVLDDYRDAVVEYARNQGAPLDGLRVVVDCGNGMAAVATPYVLRALGAEVVTLNANVDGHFPGRESKPTPETLADLREFVGSEARSASNASSAERSRGKSEISRPSGDSVSRDSADSRVARDAERPSDHASGERREQTAEPRDDGDEPRADPDAALGIGHDGDADRIVVVDGDGEVVHEDTVVAILAAHYTEQSEAGDSVVVTTPNASGRIDEQVEAAGGRVERVRLGALHEGIAAVYEDADERDNEDTEVVFAAEPWKHIHTQFGGWIDGVTSAAVICRLVAEAGGIDSLREPVTERPYRKVSVSCPDEAKSAVMERLETAILDRFPEASVETEYGVRAAMPDGSWVLVRPSGTEPYVRIYAESDDVDALVDDATEIVEDAVASVRS